MENPDLENFTLALVNCNNEDNDIRKQSTELVLNFRDQDLFGFLNALLCVLQNQSSDQIAKQLALILACQTLEKIEIPDSTMFKFQFIENNSPSLLEKLLSESISLLAAMPNLSANLFACVTTIVACYNENCDILPTLLQQLETTTDYNFNMGAFYAFDNVTSEFELSPEIYQPILFKIFTIFGDQESPLEIKSLSLKVLSNLIDEIPDVFQSEQNLETVMTVLKYSINEFDVKSSGYRCISKLIASNFPVFEPIANEAISLSVADLDENSDNEPIVLSILFLIDNLSKEYEDDYNEARKEILTQAFPSYFGSLLKIAASHDDNPSEPDTFNLSDESYATISNIIGAIPDIALGPIMEFGQTNIQSQEDALKEISLTLFSYVAYYYDNSEIVSNFLQLFPQILDEPHPRVQEAALYLLQYIIKRHYEVFKDQICSYSPNLVEMLSKQTDNYVVASQICITISLIQNLPNYKEAVIGMLQYTNTVSPLFAKYLFESIAETVNNTKTYDDLKETLPYFINILKLGITEQEYHHNLSYILYIFGKEAIKCMTFISPFLPELNPLIFQCYAQTEDPEAISCLSLLARATQGDYEPYLNDLMELLLQVSERLDSNPHMSCLSFSLNNLKKCNLDLSPYIQKFASVMIEIIQRREKDLTIFADFLYVFINYFQDEEYFILLSESVVPLIRLVFENVSILDNVASTEGEKDDERDNFIQKACMFINIVYSRAGQQESAQMQWMQLGYKIFESAAKYISLSYEYDEDRPIDIYAVLISNLFQISPEVSSEFLDSSQESQEFMSELMEYDSCKDSMNEVMSIMNQEKQEE